FLAHDPPTAARMQPATADKKYKTFQARLTDREIGDHLAGSRTYAAPLIGSTGLAIAAAGDFDTGGRAAADQLLDAAQLLGYSVFIQIVTGADGHDGGHLWALLDQPTNPARARIIIEQIQARSKVKLEIYPCEKQLRLPLGRHTHTQRRGQLLTSHQLV